VNAPVKGLGSESSTGGRVEHGHVGLRFLGQKRKDEETEADEPRGFHGGGHFCVGLVRSVGVGERERRSGGKE